MRDFTAKTRNALARKGISVLNATFIPGSDGSFANGTRAYNVNDNGCGRVLSFTQVLELAQLSLIFPRGEKFGSKPSATVAESQQRF